MLFYISHNGFCKSCGKCMLTLLVLADTSPICLNHPTEYIWVFLRVIVPNIVSGSKVGIILKRIRVAHTRNSSDTFVFHKGSKSILPRQQLLEIQFVVYIHQISQSRFAGKYGSGLGIQISIAYILLADVISKLQALFVMCMAVEIDKYSKAELLNCFGNGPFDIIM